MRYFLKINGNRIEPAEIEAAVKEELGINWCAVRGFEEDDKSYLCAYYTADINPDVAELRNALMRRLPYYTPLSLNQRFCGHLFRPDCVKPP